MVRLWRTLSVLILVTMVIVGGTAVAERREGNDTLVADEHLAIPIELAKGEEIDVRIFVAVTDGPKIDVFWMTAKAYDEYRNDDDFDHYVDYSIIGTKKVDKRFTWDGEGTFYVVLDNTASQTPPPVDPEFSNATLTYVITWEATEGTSFRDYVVYSIVAVMILFTLFLLLRYMGRNKYSDAPH